MYMCLAIDLEQNGTEERPYYMTDAMSKYVVEIKATMAIELREDELDREREMEMA